METYLLSLWGILGYALAAGMAVICARMVRSGQIARSPNPPFDRLPAGFNGWFIMTVLTFMAFGIMRDESLASSWLSSYAATVSAQSILYFVILVSSQPSPPGVK